MACQGECGKSREECERDEAGESEWPKPDTTAADGVDFVLIATEKLADLQRDRERLDFLQAMLALGLYTGRCKVRWSGTNRGMRLMETSDGAAVSDVRQAVDEAMAERLLERKP